MNIYYSHLVSKNIWIDKIEKNKKKKCIQYHSHALEILPNHHQKSEHIALQKVSHSHHQPLVLKILVHQIQTVTHLLRYCDCDCDYDYVQKTRVSLDLDRWSTSNSKELGNLLSGYHLHDQIFLFLSRSHCWQSLFPTTNHPFKCMYISIQQQQQQQQQEKMKEKMEEKKKKKKKRITFDIMEKGKEID